ncbi:MAG: diguanylate cyclase [Pseudomonadales bacterium]|nr:diguanylate cyclase [Pseudomonadales bacterium]
MKLLLVDDHSLFRDGMAMLLGRMENDMTVLQATNGQQCMDYVQQHNIDIAIVDYNLPDINGIELMQKIKTQSPETPVVIISGHEDPAIIKNALDRGASGYIPKTLEPQDIINALQLIIDGDIYVPVSVSDKLKNHKSEVEKYTGLAQLADVARKIIKEKDWSIRVHAGAGEKTSATANVINTALDSMEQERVKLEKYAFYDSLTGLANRRLFDERLEQALKNAKRKGLGVALLALDLDKFKQVNDKYGHDIGDKLLSCVAERLQKSIREIDTAARLGGDEFMLIITEISDTSAVELLVKRLFEDLCQPASLGSVTIIPNTSLGIAISDENDSPAELMKKSDIALYLAKDAGRNNYQFFKD